MRIFRSTFRPACAALALLAFAGCGGERAGGGVAADSAAVAAPAPAERGPVEDAPPLDSAALEAAMSADDSLEAFNRRTFEERRRSMGSYEECMAQARQLPPETRGRIEQACASRREGS